MWQKKKNVAPPPLPQLSGAVVNGRGSDQPHGGGEQGVLFLSVRPLFLGEPILA